MNKQYLPVKESLGYKNIKKALMSVFSIDLDNIKIEEGQFEGFGFEFFYNGFEIMINISDTEKEVQFQTGEGGIIGISLPNPEYPRKSIFKQTFLHNLILDEKIAESVEYIFGRDIKKVEFALTVLKDFLDSENAKILLRHQDAE